MNRKLIAPVPPMGWNSWNTFYEHVNEKLIRTTADAIVDQGLLDAGYEYLIIDDCWSMKQRDEHGRLVPDPDKFPGGIKSTIDYVHSKGLKFGIYSCCGVRTCADYPGSFEHEFSDAEQFADWGVDYLKYDNCDRPNSLSSIPLYRRMAMALRHSGRDILLAACQWGTEHVEQWIRSTGAHTYRTTVDIQDCWKSITSIANAQMEHAPYSASDCFSDMDMLVVGMYGKGMNPETSAIIGGCTDTEYQTHFALWAMLNSPLIIGCDVRSLSDRAREILTNKELIAINQDPECRSCYRLPVYVNPDAFILVKVLNDGDYAIGFFNFSDTAVRIPLHFWDMGLSLSAAAGMEFHDCISHEDLGLHKEVFAATVEVHGCKVYRCHPVKN
ncbi:MAG: glycoside hydrolase family 27 protein [Lachnospiraceae bacterium]|nr:glycoside hydrolase family 27 protein [Lachnospiraceae bacterium]